MFPSLLFLCSRLLFFNRRLSLQSKPLASLNPLVELHGGWMSGQFVLRSQLQHHGLHIVFLVCCFSDTVKPFTTDGSCHGRQMLGVYAPLSFLSFVVRMLFVVQNPARSLTTAIQVLRTYRSATNQMDLCQLRSVTSE